MRPASKANIAIGIDLTNKFLITGYIGQDERHKSKFLDIIGLLLEGLTNRHLYKREKINPEINNVTAMRFFVGQENDRIYCQEKSEGALKIIILSELHLHKEGNELSQEEIKIITNISKYEYTEYRN